MTGPQYREDRDPPAGCLAPGLVVVALTLGAVACICLAFWLPGPR
jgi:hypothetical protein